MKYWIPLLILCILLELAWIYFMDSKNSRLTGILKLTSSATFIYWANRCYTEAENWEFSTFVVSGIILYAIGDIILNYKEVLRKKNTKAAYLGLWALCVGHVLYAVAIFKVNTEALLIGVVAAVILSIILLWVILPSVKSVKSTRRSRFYHCVLLILAALQLCIGLSVWYQDKDCSEYLFFIIASALLLVNDTIYIYNVHSTECKKISKILYACIGFVAQIFMVIGILLMK